MSSDRLPDMIQAQRDRLMFVEFRLLFVGEIRRQDLVTRFGIQDATATRDIAQSKELTPGNMEYDTKGKVYVRGSWFRPLIDLPRERILAWLSQGCMEGGVLKVRTRAVMACYLLSRWNVDCTEDHNLKGQVPPVAAQSPGAVWRHEPGACTGL